METTENKNIFIYSTKEFENICKMKYIMEKCVLI